jgi:hypothetical protein
MRERGYRVGDVLSAELRKPRNPGFHRLVHAFGKLCVDNIDAFSGMTAHKVIKRIQLEANAACEEIGLIFPGVGPCSYRVPKSISFESMDDREFRELFTALTRHLSERYWPDCSPDEIERMAEMLV